MRPADEAADAHYDCGKGCGSPKTAVELLDALRVAVSALVAERDAMKAALTRIEKWHGEFPPTGEFWDAERTRPISYAVKHGSNGERDYMREVARAALKGKP